MSMTLILVLSFGMLVSVSVASVLGLGLWSATRNTVELLRDKAELVSSMIVHRIRRHLDPAETQVRYVARAIAAGTTNPEDIEGFKTYLHGAMAGIPQIRALVFINTDRQLVGVRWNKGKVVGYIFDFAKDPAVIAAIAAGRGRTKAVWSEIIWRKNYQEALINLRQPVHRDGKFIGILVALVGVDELSGYLGKINKATRSTTFILQGRDRVLAHTAMRKGYQGLSPREPLPKLNGFKDPVLGAIWNKRDRRAMRIPLRAPLKHHTVRVANGEYVFIYRTISGYSNKPWIVGNYIDIATVGSEVRRLILSGVAGLVALVLAIGIAIWIGRRLPRPIQRLSAAAAHIRNMDLDDVDKLPGSRIREFDQQAEAFNSMVTGLRWFETYVPKRLVNRLIREGDQVGMISDNRSMTVMFTDIAGFSTISENMSAPEVAEFVNEHFAIVAKCIEDEEGTVDKFIGDSVMAFWGAPEKQKNRAERACRAALAMRAAINADNDRREGEGLARVRMRIGIHSGAATAGNIGAPGRLNYTVIGDMVNVGQRLEQLSKEVLPDDEVAILFSDATRADLGADFAPKPVGKHHVKGREEKVEVFTL